MRRRARFNAKAEAVASELLTDAAAKATQQFSMRSNAITGSRFIGDFES
jgi:hypothetical protein